MIAMRGVWPPARRNSDHPWFRTCSCERTRAENSSAWSTNWVPFRPVRRDLCIVETEGVECPRPRAAGSQLCAVHDEETDRLAADRLAAGWPS